MQSNKVLYNEIKDVSDEELDKIRDTFLLKFKAKVKSEEYHPKDIERIQKNNDWVRAFYKHSFGDNEKAVDMINEVLEWRNQFGANDLLKNGQLPFDEKIFTIGELFMRNHDKNGNKILHFPIKTHKKGRFPSDQFSKFVAYSLEREYKFNICNPIVFMFDMTDAGLSNTDMDFTKFLVNLLKTYYPGLIDYIIIYDMPFILNAIWKIVKTLLPAKAVELVKFVDRKTIRQFVDQDQLFVHMGGTDDFKYDPNDPSLRPPSSAN